MRAVWKSALNEGRAFLSCEEEGTLCRRREMLLPKQEEALVLSLFFVGGTFGTEAL